MAAILQAFNSQLLDLRDKAIELDSEAEWRKDILLQMQVQIGQTLSRGPVGHGCAVQK